MDYKTLCKLDILAVKRNNGVIQTIVNSTVLYYVI